MHTLCSGTDSLSKHSKALDFSPTWPFFSITLQRESTAILFYTHLYYKVSLCGIRRQSVKTRGPCGAPMCVLFGLESFCDEFYPSHAPLWLTNEFRESMAHGVFFFFNKSKGEARQTGHQSSCQDLSPSILVKIFNLLQLPLSTSLILHLMTYFVQLKSCSVGFLATRCLSLLF